MTSGTRALSFVALAAIAGGLMLWITAPGPGINPDSTAYLETATSIAAGRGFYAAGAPMTHFAPGYPLILAIPGVLGADIVHAARILNAALCGINVVLFACAIYVATSRSGGAAFAGALFFLSSKQLLTIHSYVWSEPLFLAGVMGSLLLLSSHITQPRLSRLVASASLMGLAIATRYIGIALLPPMLVGVVIAARNSRRSTMRDLAITLLLTCGAMVAWSIRNAGTGGFSADYALAVHPVFITAVKTLIVTVHDYMLNIQSAPRWLKAADLAALAWLVAACWRYGRVAITGAKPHAITSPIVPLGLASAAIYVLSLLFSSSFVNITTSMDSRLMAPAILLAAPAVTAIVLRGLRGMASRTVWLAFGVVLLTAGAVNARAAVPWMNRSHQNGQDYSSNTWRASETIAYVRSLPGNIDVYSNDPWAIRFLGNRPARLMPLDFIPATGLPNAAFGAELTAMCDAAALRGAALVWLDATGSWFASLRDRFVSACTSLTTTRFADGTVYVR